jgi:transketolase
LYKAQRRRTKPTAIIANTVKGKGVSFMENNPAFHGRSPNAEEFQKAMEELA